MPDVVTISLPPEPGLKTRRRLKTLAAKTDGFIGEIADTALNIGLDELEKKARTTPPMKSGKN